MVISIIALMIGWYYFECKAAIDVDPITNKFKKLSPKRERYAYLATIFFYAWIGNIIAWIITSM